MTNERREQIDRIWTNYSVPLDQRLLYVPCFSLNTIMKALAINQIDYLSLDVEGGELEVVESIDYDKLKIDAISVEIVWNNRTKNQIIDHLVKNNYKFLRDSGIDAFFSRLD